MYNLNNIKLDAICQEDFSGEVLVDADKTGKERPWRAKKMRNMALAELYDQFDECKAARLRDCGKFLQFKVFADGTKKLHHANSCRVRLCPICAWRRSLKTYYNNMSIINHILQDKEYSFIFLTFTVRNCRSDELSDTIDEMMKAMNRLRLRPEWKKAVKGCCRCLEVTHNIDKSSKDFNTFHPHFHMLCCVNKSYFKSSAYLSQEKWTNLWASVMHIDYNPIVNVEKCYGNTASAVAECSKYSTKDTEYIIPKEWDLSLQTVQVLDKVLANRRLVAYTGIFKTTKALLRLEDEETGSLVAVGEADELLNLDQPYDIQEYYWYSGYKQYMAIN